MNGGESPLSSWQDEPTETDLIVAEAIERLSLIDQPAFFIEEGA